MLHVGPLKWKFTTAATINVRSKTFQHIKHKQANAWLISTGKFILKDKKLQVCLSVGLTKQDKKAVRCNSKCFIVSRNHILNSAIHLAILLKATPPSPDWQGRLTLAWWPIHILQMNVLGSYALVCRHASTTESHLEILCAQSDQCRKKQTLDTRCREKNCMNK